MLKKRYIFPFFIAFIAALIILPGVKTSYAETTYNPVPYEDIGEILEQHERESDRISVEVIGQSALGLDLYAVTIFDPEDDEGMEESENLRDLMIENPQKAQEYVDENPDVKVPFMINGSVHGNEYAGTDAVLKLIERFGYENDEITNEILDNNILVFNVVANPDGRVLGTRQNSNGYDLNRDFVTISQSETDANIDLIVDWLPMVHLDLHGYVIRSNETPGLIEPTTAPHNPNNEHDLYVKWALKQAEAMEEEVVENRDNFEDEMYRNMEGTHIPYRDAEDGWDDYPPIFTPGYTMYHGAYVATLETPTNSVDGVDWHYHTVMGALKFATENKIDMLSDQIEVFRRGVDFDHPQNEDDFFPRAYVLPVDEADSSVTMKAVNHLLKSGIEVKEAETSFTIDGEHYEEGTYIVKMNQARAGLANTLLWDGEDITDQVSAMYDISGWSLPELWGFDAIATHSSVDLNLSDVEKVELESELDGDGPYELKNSSVESIALVNELIQNNYSVYKAHNGHFYIESEEGLDEIVRQTQGLLLKTKSIPEHSTLLEEVSVALLKTQGQPGALTALNLLGFQVDEIDPKEVEVKGLEDYDILVVNGSANYKSDSYKQRIETFIDDGGKYIAIGANASEEATELGLADFTVNSGGRNSNGIVKINYRDTSLTKGYEDNDFGFVYNPTWYTDLESDRLVASYAEEDFFQAGFWKNSQTAEGQPVIAKGHHPGVTFIGMEISFRAHPEHLFRLFSNAIYPSDETNLTTVSGMIERVNRYESEIENDDVKKALKIHLESVNHYVKKEDGAKVIKHMEGFELLLNHYQNQESISDKLYDILKIDTQSVIKKWQ